MIFKVSKTDLDQVESLFRRVLNGPGGGKQYASVLDLRSDVLESAKDLVAIFNDIHHFKFVSFDRLSGTVVYEEKYMPITEIRRTYDHPNKELMDLARRKRLTAENLHKQEFSEAQTPEVKKLSPWSRVKKFASSVLKKKKVGAFSEGLMENRDRPTKQT